MPDQNQGPNLVPPLGEPGPGPFEHLPSPPPLVDETARRARRGLQVWLGTLLFLGAGSMLLGQPEAGGLVAIAGLFAAAHAADLDPGWRQAWLPLSFVTPLGGVAFFGYLGLLLLHADLPAAQRVAGVVCAAAGILVLGLSALPAFVDGFVRRLFAGVAPSYALRLGVQLTLAGLLLGVPAWFAFESIKETVLENPEALLERGRLSGGLVGYVVLALGGVGCWVRRDLRQAFDRLGLKAITLRHAGVIALGAIALIALNAGAEAVQHRFFPELWKADHEVTTLLARHMTPGRVVLLGLSAGIGEEVTLRGGLQPKLGILLTSVLFAALHVQYSWFGMVLVFALGVTLGLIRQHTSTTAAIVVHGLYDMLAVFTT